MQQNSNPKFMKSTSLHKPLLVFSVISLIYFIWMIYISYYPPESTQAIQIIGEIITLPLLLFTLFGLVYSLIMLFRKKELKYYLIVFLLNLLTFLLLVYITYDDMK